MAKSHRSLDRQDKVAATFLEVLNWNFGNITFAHEQGEEMWKWKFGRVGFGNLNGWIGSLKNPFYYYLVLRIVVVFT